MSLVVHHSAMYVAQKQSHDVGEPSVLARVVTPVSGGPATFNGLAPSSPLELAEYGDNNDDFSTGALTAWASNQWVSLGDFGYFNWNGTGWVPLALANGLTIASSENAEGIFTGGRAPATEEELYSATFGQTTAWAEEGMFIRLGGIGTGGPKYHWAGSTDKWKPGSVPA